MTAGGHVTTAVERLQSTFERRADAPLLVDGATGHTLTYGEAQQLALALATELGERGVSRGDRIAVALPNGAEMALVYLAALLRGIAVVPVGVAFGRRELRDVLSGSRPVLALTGGERPHEALVDAAQATGVAGLSLAVAGTPGDLDPFAASAGAEGTPFEGVTDDDLASIHFTSGSTGTPRGVGHRLRDFVANAERYASACGLDESHRFHCALPMTYMAGYYNLLLLPLTIGASVVLDRSFDARSVLDFWSVADRHDADVLWLVPTIMAMLLKLDRAETGRAYTRERVRHVACGTAPLDPELRATFEREYGVTVHDSYGLSETLLATASTPERPSPPRGVGRALPGVEVAVATDTPGAAGAILIRSADTTLGYLVGGSAEAELRFEPAADHAGWLDTGDVGTIDEDGEVRITGREKEIVIRGGVNISAIEVEEALAGIDGVERLAVVGVPHGMLGEQVAVVTVCARGAAADEAESALRARAVDALEAAKRPDVYLQIDAMPLTPTGKVRKGALRDIVIDLLDLPAGAKGFAVDARESRETEAGPWALDRPIDLTHRIREGMTSYPSPNHPTPEVTVLARHETEGRMTRRLVLGTHTGTHADAPLHFVPDGETIDQVSLGTLVGPAVVADLTPVGALEEISRERLEAALGGAPAHPRVLLRFGWDERFVDQRFYSESPYLTGKACRWLVDRGVRVLGMDSPSPDDPRLGPDNPPDSPNHQILLGAGVVLLEYLTGLDRIGTSEVLLVALPLPVEGADGAPMRAIAFESLA